MGNQFVLQGLDSRSPLKLRCILSVVFDNSLLLFQQYSIVKKQYLEYIVRLIRLREPSSRPFSYFKNIKISGTNKEKWIIINKQTWVKSAHRSLLFIPLKVETAED